MLDSLDKTSHRKKMVSRAYSINFFLLRLHVKLLRSSFGRDKTWKHKVTLGEMLVFEWEIFLSKDQYLKFYFHTAWPYWRILLWKPPLFGKRVVYFVVSDTDLVICFIFLDLVLASMIDGTILVTKMIYLEVLWVEQGWDKVHVWVQRYQLKSYLDFMLQAVPN